eukprot:m.18761 g.18761  ORF g.18761 m.18761 type:complete len:686 (+) comp6398_c0_seq1:138-2195(+)
MKHSILLFCCVVALCQHGCDGQCNEDCAAACMAALSACTTACLECSTECFMDLAECQDNCCNSGTSGSTPSCSSLGISSMETCTTACRKNSSSAFGLFSFNGNQGCLCHYGDAFKQLCPIDSGITPTTAQATSTPETLSCDQCGVLCNAAEIQCKNDGFSNCDSIASTCISACCSGGSTPNSTPASATKKTWVTLATNVPLKALNGPGAWVAPEDICASEIRFTHLKGSVACCDSEEFCDQPTNIGCEVESTLGILMSTRSARCDMLTFLLQNCDLIAPSYDDPDIIMESMTMPFYKHKSGVTPNSKSITLMLPKKNYCFKRWATYYLWYGEDFVDGYYSDNVGTSYLQIEVLSDKFETVTNPASVTDQVTTPSHTRNTDVPTASLNVDIDKDDGDAFTTKQSEVASTENKGGVTTLGNEKFSCFNVPKTFAEAAADCRRRDLQLAALKSSEEEQALVKFGEAIDSDVWIALNDIDEEGSFVWQDETSLTFENWGFGQPSSEGDENCVVLSRDDDFQWHDVTCSQQVPYCCSSASSSSSTSVTTASTNKNNTSAESSGDEKEFPVLTVIVVAGSVAVLLAAVAFFVVCRRNCSGGSPENNNPRVRENPMYTTNHNPSGPDNSVYEQPSMAQTRLYDTMKSTDMYADPDSDNNASFYEQVSDDNVYEQPSSNQVRLYDSMNTESNL